MTSFLADIRYAVRMMLKSRLVTAIAVVSLALGIGANCAMFSFVDFLTFRPLPVPAAARVLNLYTGLQSGGGRSGLSYAEFRDLQDQTSMFSKLGVLNEMNLSYADLGDGTDASHPPVPASAAGITADLFDVLGVRLALGRTFNREEDRVLNTQTPVILSYHWWERMHGKDPGILDRKVRINGRVHTVVGVAQEGFRGLDRYQAMDFYVPIALRESALPSKDGVQAYGDRANRWLAVYGRLKDGVSKAQANAELTAIASRWADQHPATNAHRVLRALTEPEAAIEGNPEMFAMSVALLILTGLVLMIACANVANLLMSRAGGRRREIAVRIAIGASRRRLLRQLLTESALLSLLGTAGGLMAAYWVTGLLRAIELPTDLPVVLDVQINSRALLFALLGGVVTTFLFGLVPALQLSRPDLIPALKNAVQNMPAGRFRISLRGILVTGQLAASLVLLILSGLVLKGLMVMENRKTGFRVDHSLMMSLDPRMNGYTPEQANRLQERVLEKVRTEPGVLGATMIYPVLTGSDGDSTKVWIDGYDMPKDRDSLRISSASVADGYFETMETPVIEGRGFRESDDESHPLVIVINKNMAEKYWPGQSAVGKRLRIGGSKGEYAEVVGMTGTGVYREAMEIEQPFLFRPLRQNYTGVVTMIVHTASDPAGQASQMRSAVRRVDPALAVYDVRSLERLYAGKAMLGPNLVTRILMGVGLLGLVLALTGLFGVIAYSVAQRTREIGIRLALGATEANVRGMVLWQGMRYFAIGAPVGVALALLLLKPIAMFTAGVNPYAVDTLIGIPVLLGLVTAAAALAPAQQAARIHPSEALRQE